MPQMAPLNWLTLYFFFFGIFIMFLNMNYFNKLNTMDILKTKTLKKLHYTWKW